MPDTVFQTGLAVFGIYCGILCYVERQAAWQGWQAVALLGGVLLGMEILNLLLPFLFGGFKRIPVKADHLDKLETKDITFIILNRVTSAPFVYHVGKYCFYSGDVITSLQDVSIWNSVGALCGLYVVYDFPYSLFHRFLHVRKVYAWVHKHHHRQHTPTRGNLDAMNVHPFEFIAGEYNHLLAVYLLAQMLPVHIVAVAAFIALGGVGASLNHTRYDVNLPFGSYSAKAHDVHHRIPQSNYGQYLMLWDQLFGSFRPYDQTSGAPNKSVKGS